MASIETIIKVAKENNGIITTAMVVLNGISRGSLKHFVDKGLIEKVSRGVYILPEFWEDEFINLQSRFKRGIFSLETALFLCDLTDRTPNRYSMTFPNTYNVTQAKAIGVICSQSQEPMYSMGIVDLKTPNGNIVKGYCVERTLCDILKPRNHIDIQIVSEAYKRYAKGKSRNIPLLSEFAKILKVEKRLRAYLEVLL